MTSAPQNASAKEISRVFALQQAHQWDVKASSAAERKAKLAKLKAAIEAHADAIVAKINTLKDTLSTAANAAMDPLDKLMNPPATPAPAPAPAS